MDEVERIRQKYERLALVMDERTTRLWAATEARALGRGGTAAVTRATGISGKRIRTGMRELDARKDTLSAAGPPRTQRIRRAGGGRKRLEEHDPQLVKALERLVEPSTRGDPQSPLCWTSKSVRKLAKELTEKGHPVGTTRVAQLLAELGYSLQGNRKTHEGGQYPERNAQFEHINEQAKVFQARGQPVISVDAKKKELVGNFKNGGREWQPKGKPVPVGVYDFVDDAIAKVTPYGVYDLMRNEGWVNVGVDHDTAEFAVESIRRWWYRMGREAYPNATDLMVTADCGGSNGARVRLWKRELQRFADETGLSLNVCHYPPGTSKWNKIEHRMSSHITQNWRGRPLESLEAVVNLIGATTTRAGLHIEASLDERHYDEGIKISKREMRELNLHADNLHADSERGGVEPSH